MDDKYYFAREQFFPAIRILAASTGDIQSRLIYAYRLILLVRIDDFDHDPELKIKFARILDSFSVDKENMEELGSETAAQMTDMAAIKVADLICDFYGDLG